MNKIKNLKDSKSLNDAFDLITKIFNEEREYYENSINSLKEKISKLEDTLLQVKKENMNYQQKISKLKGKIRSISKTVLKLEESEFEVKLENNKNIENKEINNNENNKHHNTIKYRNTDTINTFRKKTKIFSEINNSTSINIKSNNNFFKMNVFDKNKLNNNGEDITRNYNKKIHKKTLSTKIKNNILNFVQQNKQIQGKNDNNNNMFKSHCYNDEDVSFFIIDNLNENELESKMTVPVERDTKIKEKRKKNFVRDKYNKIEQKIKGLKSALSIYNNHGNPISSENYNK